MKCIENTDKGFLDTNLTSFGSTRKPGVFCLRVAKRIEKTDFKSASFMMLCLNSIVVYGNADGKDTRWFPRYITQKFP